MKSLADVLGVQDIQLPDKPVAEPGQVRLTAKTLSRELLNSKQYRESLLRRIIMDELPAAVECKLMEYAWGKPIERVEVEDKTLRPDQLSTASPEQIEQRALFLANLARQLRMNDAVPAESSDGEDPAEPSSVH